MKARTLTSIVLSIILLAVAAPARDLALRVKELARGKDLAAAQQLLEKNRPPQPHMTSEWLTAASWLARGAGAAGQWDLARQYAQEVFDGGIELLKKRALDSDPDLALALGAAIEVLADAYDAGGNRDAAVRFLRRQIDQYHGTSIETRIQKNLLQLSLEGQPFPGLEVEQRLGSSRTPAELKGKVVLFFFWAHWCSDCKAQKPILDALHQRYAAEGLEIVGPTQFYGYIAGGEDATPEQELAYLQGAYQQNYPIPSWMSVPISNKNFTTFGVSSTPTLVLVDRAGIVRLYHPGKASHEELAARIEPLLAGASDN